MSEESTSPKIPTWFWVVAGIALVWNLLGVFSYIGQMMLMSNPEVMAELPADQQALYENTPAWATGAFAVAVWGGAIGCLLLLLKKKAAKIVLIVSLAGVLVQMVHSFFMSNNFEVFGPGGMVMTVMIIVVAIGLVWFADKSIKEGWIN